MNKLAVNIATAFVAMVLSLPVKAQTPNVMVVVDMSTSTFGECEGISFQEMEFQFAEQLANSLDNSVNWGFSAFAGQWTNVCQPASGRIQAKGMVSLLRAEKDCAQKGRIHDGTAIYSALLNATSALTEKESRRSILLLTDGSDNRSNISANFIIQWMQDKQIRVDVVGFSSRDCVSYPMMLADSVQNIKVLGNQDYQEVQRIAEATNGVFVRVTKKSDIDAAVQKIEQSIRQGALPTTPPPTGYIDERLKGWLLDRIAKDEIKLF